MATGLEQQLWASADILRGKMDASEYKNYLLGLIFYKYLSDAELREVYEQENGATTTYPERSVMYQSLLDWYEEDPEEVADIIRLQKGYFIAPDQLFYTYRQQADRYEFNLTDLQAGFNELERQVHYHGQELNTTTYNLARMNLILHGVDKDRMNLNNGDTLDADWPTEEPHQFDAVVMNPPYSAKWSAADKFLSDPRFERFGKLAPKSKADFAFLLHGFYHLKDTGTMAIVLPHGVLFRGAAEGAIRQALLEMGAIDAVIGLPANIFYGTSIPTTVIVLKKNRENRDVLFIDASNDFDKQKNQNVLLPEHIEKIVQAYKQRENIDKYTHVASFEEIKENDFNLNIPRYVDTFEEEEPIDLVKVSEELAQVEAEMVATQAELLNMINDLAVTDESKDIIEATKRILVGGQHE